MRRPSGRGLPLLTAALALLAQARSAQAQAVDPTTPPPPPPADPVPPPPPTEPPAPPPPSFDDVVDLFDDQNRVPDNPAMDVLDAKGLNVLKPGSTKDLATDLRALYAGGKVLPQVAIELSPYVLSYGRRTSYDDYLRHTYVRILHRLHVSVATTNVGEGAKQATVGALGVRIRLFDRSDWRLDTEAVRCALAAAELAKPPPRPDDMVVVPVDDNVNKQEARRVQACFDQAKKRRGSWNASQLAIGGAISSAFPGGKLQADIRDLTGWIAWGHRLGPSSHLVVAGKYLFSDTRKDTELRIPARHTTAVAVQAERRFDRFGLVGSTGFGLRWTDDPSTLDVKEWTRALVLQLGGEVQVRITEGTWVAFKTTVLLVDDDDGEFLSLANFKWNFDVKASKAKKP